MRLLVSFYDAGAAGCNRQTHEKFPQLQTATKCMRARGTTNRPIFSPKQCHSALSLRPHPSFSLPHSVLALRFCCTRWLSLLLLLSRRSACATACKPAGTPQGTLLLCWSSVPLSLTRARCTPFRALPPSASSACASASRACRPCQAAARSARPCPGRSWRVVRLSRAHPAHLQAHLHLPSTRRCELAQRV